MASSSTHRDEIGTGFGGVKSASDYFGQSSNQSLRLGPHRDVSMPETAFANANSVQVSSGIDDPARRASSSNVKASKKKDGYHQRQGIKKPRLLWVNDLQQHFLEIYNSLPPGKVYPKKILEQMRIKYPFVTRENIASHLQKHRLLLKKKNSKDNSAKSSSTPVPFKAPKESKSQPIHNITFNSNSTIPNSQLLLQSHSNSTSPNSQLLLQSHFNSTNPNSQLLLQSHSNSTNHNAQLLLQSHVNSTNPNAQLLLQSHSNSTNPNPQLLFQSHSNSTDPNAQLLYQSHSNSTNPNSQFLLQSHSNCTDPNYHLPLQKKAHIKHETLLNPEVHYHFDQLNVSDQTMMQQQHPSFNIGQINNNNGHVGSAINWGPGGQSSSVELAYGNGNAFHPTMDYNSFGGLNNTYNNDHFLGTPQNFPLGDYNMNLNYDNVQHDDGNNNNIYYSETLDCPHPLNFNASNDFQTDLEQNLSSVNHHVEDKPFGSNYNHLLPQTFVNPENSWVEQPSNVARMNEHFPSKFIRPNY